MRLKNGLPFLFERLFLNGDSFLSLIINALRNGISQTDMQDPPSSILVRHEALFSDRSNTGLAPRTKKTKTNKNRFWMEESNEVVVVSLISLDRYAARVLRTSALGDFLVEEYIPKSSSLLPSYVAHLPVYTEKECRSIILQLAKTIQVLHAERVAHRNLHINNIVVNSSGKLSIQGMRYAKVVSEYEPLQGFSGFRHNWYAFRAPEAEGDGAHDESADIWSLGAILYLLLTGLPPFRGTGRDLIANKHMGNVEYDTMIPSPSAQALVRDLLQVNREDRLTIEEVLEHEWMLETDEVLSNYDLSLPQDLLQDWTREPKMRENMPDPYSYRRIEV